MSLIIEALSKARQQGGRPPFEADLPVDSAASPKRIFSKRTVTLLFGMILVGIIGFGIFQEGRKTPLSPGPGGPVVQGVFLDGKEPVCLIKGKIFKVGDAWNGQVIAAIHDQGVTFEK